MSSQWFRMTTWTVDQPLEMPSDPKTPRLLLNPRPGAGWAWNESKRKIIAAKPSNVTPMTSRLLHNHERQAGMCSRWLYNSSLTFRNITSGLWWISQAARPPSPLLPTPYRAQWAELSKKTRSQDEGMNIESIESTKTRVEECETALCHSRGDWVKALKTMKNSYVRYFVNFTRLRLEIWSIEGY